MDIKEENILGPHINKHWYYISKGRAMRRFLNGVPRQSLLDVGAGSGVFSKILLEHGSNQAVCIDPAYEAGTKARTTASPFSLYGRSKILRPI